MSERDIHYTPPPTLKRFMRSDAFVRLVIGPFGSGKSTACIMELLRRAAQVPAGPDGVRRSRCAIVRNTYPELRDTTRKTFEQWVPSGPRGLGEWSEADFTFHMAYADVECEVLFRSLDRPKDIKKLLSLDLTFAYFNEVREIGRGLFDAMQGRVGRYPRVSDVAPEKWLVPDLVPYWNGVWADTNPPDTDHWIYRLFEAERPEAEIEVPHRVTGEKVKVKVAFEVFHQPSGRSDQAENLEHLKPGYYQTLALGKDPEWVKVYVDGQYGFVIDGRPVWPEYQDQLHCPVGPKAIQPNPSLPIFIGQDFGLTPAAVLAQVDPADGQLQIFDELVCTNMSAKTFAAEMLRLLGGSYPRRPYLGWGDPAGEQRAQSDASTAFQVMRAAGYELHPAPTNDFSLRREAVARLLRQLGPKGRPLLAISEKCRMLRKALIGGYSYQRRQVAGKDAFADVPTKNEFSHVSDALQYVCVGRGDHMKVLLGDDYQLPAGGAPLRCVTEFNHLEEDSHG